MKIKEIAFSSYTVTDIKRARAFYEGILELKAASVFEQEGMTFVEYEIGPHTLSIGSGVPNFKPGTDGGMVVFEVDDFDSSVAELRKKGVKFTMDSQDTGVCHMAIISDPDGNLLMIHKKK